MKCENCGKNEVSFVFQRSINGQTEEKHLCHQCAQQLGYAKALQESYAGMETLLRGGFAPLRSSWGLLSGANRNPFSGEDLWDDEFFGGDLFGNSLFGQWFAPPRLTGAQSPSAAPAEQQADDLLSSGEQQQLNVQRETNALRAALKQAVETENFERAAELRDEIRAKQQRSDEV